MWFFDINFVNDKNAFVVKLTTNNIIPNQHRKSKVLHDTLTFTILYTFTHTQNNGLCCIVVVVVVVWLLPTYICVEVVD